MRNRKEEAADQEVAATALASASEMLTKEPGSE